MYRIIRFLLPDWDWQWDKKAFLYIALLGFWLGLVRGYLEAELGIVLNKWLWIGLAGFASILFRAYLRYRWDQQWGWLRNAFQPPVLPGVQEILKDINRRAGTPLP